MVNQHGSGLPPPPGTGLLKEGYPHFGAMTNMTNMTDDSLMRGFCAASAQ